MPVSFSLIRENLCQPWFYEIFSKEQETMRFSCFFCDFLWPCSFLGNLVPAWPG